MATDQDDIKQLAGALNQVVAILLQRVTKLQLTPEESQQLAAIETLVRKLQTAPVDPSRTPPAVLKPST